MQNKFCLEYSHQFALIHNLLGIKMHPTAMRIAKMCKSRSKSMTIILRGHEIQENTVELQDEDCNISDCEEYLSQEKCLNEILVPEFM